MTNPSQIGEIRGGGGSQNELGPDAKPIGEGSMPSTGRRAEYAGAPADVSLQETASTATGALRKQASRLAQDVGQELSKTSESQKERGVEALREIARAIDGAADQLQEPVPTIARSVHEVARRINGFSDNLADRNVNELIDQAAQLARAQPALFVGGSVVAGFALARFLWSSGRHGSAPSQGYVNDLHQP